MDDNDHQLLVEKESFYNVFSCRLFVQVLFPLIGGFLFGYDTGVISGAMLLLRNQFHMSSFLQEVVVSVTIFAAAVSALLIGFLAERKGRKMCLTLSGVMYLGGSLFLALSRTTMQLIVGRIIVGLGVGICATCCPIYISEIAPESIRGRLILLYNLSIIGGQLVATIVNASFYSLGPESWRYMLGIAAAPGLAQVIGMLFVPESYRWLISKQQIGAARSIIIADRRIPEEDIDDYIHGIEEQNRQLQEQIKLGFDSNRSFFAQVMTNKLAFRTLLIGCALQMLAQIIGINTVMYYTGTMIRMAGVKDISSILWMSAAAVAICFVPAVLGFWLIDRIGRRKLAFLSLMGTFLFLLMIAISFQKISTSSEAVTSIIPRLHSQNDIYCSHRSDCELCTTSAKCGFCMVTNYTSTRHTYCLAVNTSFATYSNYGPCSKESMRHQPASQTIVFNFDYCFSHYSWLVIVGIVLYLCSFCIGMGPIPWTITSEIYPLWCREFNMSISTFTNWTFNLIISLTFLTLTESITKYGTFYLYSSFAFFGLFFIYFCLPETNQKTLEEISVQITSDM